MLISVQIDVTDEMVDDITTTALEGGITYWCDRAEQGVPYRDGEGVVWLSMGLTHGGTIRVHDAEEDSWHEITHERMAYGIVRAAAHMGESLQSFYDNHDATGADVAVQYALFDEVRYG